MSRTHSDTDEPTRKERRELYERVVSVVDHQTSPKQRPIVARHTIMQVLAAHANHDVDRVNSALRAAVSNDDLLRVGENYAPTGEAHCRRLVEWAVEHEDLDDRKRWIGTANTALAEGS